MRINGEKFESRNEKIIPIVRHSGNFFLIAVAIDNIQAINEKVDLHLQDRKARVVKLAKPGEKAVVADNEANRQLKADDFRFWVDGVVVHSLQSITRDQVVTNPLPEPEEGWADGTPDWMKVEEETQRVKYPIEWETVDVTDIETWKNWRDEMRESLLNDAEITRIANGCLEANSLSEASVELAMEDFLALPPVEIGLVSGPPAEPGNTQSGALASVSEPDLPE